jgi:ketosteroid isomerase-like protein
VPGSAAWDPIETKDLLVRVYGAAAVVTARRVSASVFRGRPFREEERLTDVYIRRAGRWRCVHTHLSCLATGAGTADPTSVIRRA